MKEIIDQKDMKYAKNLMDSPPNEINIQRQQQPPNFDDSSIYTTGDISDILLSPSPPRISTSKEKNQGEAVQQFSSLHFLNKSDLLIKISRIIFEDFQNNILILNSRNHGDSEGNSDDQFTEIIQKFMEVCECGVKGIEKICTEMGHVDPNSKNMLNKLTLERAAYSLMLRIHNSNKLLIDNQDLISTSFLTKLFRENDHFRRISILLLWSEECSMFSPTEFSRIADEDAMKLAGLDNIYACTKLRAPVNLDSRFVDRIAAEDEESVQTLNRVLFSLLRSGRLQDAKTLLDNVGLSALSAFIFIREFLNSPKLSPLDRFDDNFGLAQSRMHFKQTAKDLIPMDDERIQRTDHCIWATLGGHLPTLLSYAQCTDDRLWAYLSCAAEALLDQALCSFHAKLDDQISVLANDMVRENEDLPTTVHSIFTELQINEASPYYKLFAHLALEQWTAAAKFIDDCIQNKEQQMTAHELRFFVHLMLLLKLTRRPPNAQFMDRLIEQYSGLLVEMKLKGSVPLYLYHLSADQSVPRMLDFLEEIMLEPEQREVLESALSAGFDVTELCREIFYRFKAKYRFDNEQTEQQISKSADELVRAWKWLTYCMPETIWHAIVEANFILRKLFLHNRMSEATALMRMAPESLAADALKVFRNDYPDEQVPAKLLNATREFECYQLYFEAIRRYGEWQKQVEGSEAPEMPAKLSDERWARMDIRRRAEYELNVKKAREILQKYYRVVELYKKNAVEGLENVLKTPDGWLATSQADEESADQEVVERSHDFVEIRKQFLANLLELLVDVHSRSNESMRVLDVASLMMDPRYSLHKSITKDKLQKLLTQISANGAALL